MDAVVAYTSNTAQNDIGGHLGRAVPGAKLHMKRSPGTPHAQDEKILAV